MDHPSIPPVSVLSLFSGIGGLDLGLQLAAPGSQVLGYVEREPFAQALLLEGMATQALDSAPLWGGDLCKCPLEIWRDRVDCITAGFPCPPFSFAGRGSGVQDPRWLWSEIVRAIRTVRPSLVFLENVRGLLVHQEAIRQILGDLARDGFDAEWDLFSASQVGRNHQRARWFLLAHRQGVQRRLLSEPPRQVSDTPEPGRGGSDILADSEGDRLPRGVPPRTGSSGSAPTGHRLCPPRPDQRALWFELLRERFDLAPSVPEVLRVADGFPDELDAASRHRVDRITALGNAVVPDQAALAFRVLWGRLMGP